MVLLGFDKGEQGKEGVCGFVIRKVYIKGKRRNNKVWEIERKEEMVSAREIKGKQNEENQ